VVRHLTSGGLRILLFFALAVPLMLIGGWLFDSGQAIQLASQFTAVLIIAFTIMMAGFPLFIWVYPVIAEAPFLVPAIIFGLSQTAVITFIFRLLQANPWIANDPQFQRFLGWGAIGTILVGVLFMNTAKNWRSIAGHLLLVNMGMAMLTLTMPLENAWDTALLAHISRFLSLLLLGVALSLLTRYQESDQILESRGFGRQIPFTTGLLILACLSLLGMPLTIGFPAQLAILDGFDGSGNLLLLVVLILGLAAGIYSMLRLLLVLFYQRQNPASHQETAAMRALISLFMIGFTLLALYPQPLLDYTARLAGAIPG